ncbi:uncharacterized protein LOC111638468 isoform X2 [Centruroides sculpturatus]|uniref:uncharacterized protein LOC111638468 isoform X2 n=1 Tax=Centruroides sculpturatus TaxID=218467 RepID=UPI000C6E7EF0|nr:uncharacterized protein LOC111638468 isoform X2 [Centruroides sculpturatus]
MFVYILYHVFRYSAKRQQDVSAVLKLVPYFSSLAAPSQNAYKISLARLRSASFLLRQRAKMAAPCLTVLIELNNRNFLLNIDEKTYESFRTGTAPNIKNYFKELQKTFSAADLGLPEGTDILNWRQIKLWKVFSENNGTFECGEQILIIDDNHTELQENPVVVGSPDPSKSIHNKSKEWTHAAVKLLIASRIDLEEDFQKPVVKTKLWAKIADKLSKEGFAFTSSECDHKWRNLMITYRKNVDKSKTSGEGKIRWEYFKELHETFGRNINTNPPINYMKSSSKINSKSSNCMNECTQEVLTEITCAQNRDRVSIISTENSTVQVNPVPVAAETSCTQLNKENECTAIQKKKDKNELIKSRKRSRNEPPLWYVEDMKRRDRKREEREKKEDERWQEHKELETRKVQVLEKLVELLQNVQKTNSS